MGVNIPQDHAAAAITKIATAVVADNARSSVIAPAGSPSDLTAPTPGSTVSGNSPSFYTEGTGTGNGTVLSNVAGAFDPAAVHLVGVNPTSAGTPVAPRAGAAYQTYITGVTGDTMQVSVQWTPPLVDTSGRWLLMNSEANGVVTLVDLLDSYIVVRETPGTGEVHTVGVIAHNEQAVSLIKTYLEAHTATTTDPKTLQVTFDPSIIVGGLVTLPGPDEVWFTFTDTTAQYGTTYIYHIHAITQAQIESAALDITPQAATAGGALSVQAGSSWVSSYPDPTNPGGALSYADLSFTVSGITTSVQIGVVALQANALPVSTVSHASNYPYVEYTVPSEAIITPPTTAGNLMNVIHFRAAYIEANGGAASFSFSQGITAVTPLSTGLSKVAVPGSATGEYDYALEVNVPNTALAGPVTMAVVCGNGTTALCSAITVGAPAASNSAPVFTAPTLTTPTLATDMVLLGTGLNNITALKIYNSAGVLQGTATIVNQGFNSIEFTYTLPAAGTYKITSTLGTGITSSGKDVAYLTYNPAASSSSATGASASAGTGSGTGTCGTAVGYGNTRRLINIGGPQ